MKRTMSMLVFFAALALPAILRAQPTEVPNGRLEKINGYRVVSVWGTPKEMGTAYGQLLADDIKHVIGDMITDGIANDEKAYANMMQGSAVMEKHQPKEFLDELKAIAVSAKVKYEELLLLQYFGDVRRCIRGAGSSSLCTSFAILPPYTKDGTCIVGRNLDYFDNGVSEYAAIIAYYRPEGKIPFMTVTWAGIINGWTLLNEKGIVTSNNTVFRGTDSLKGISTCNMLRYIAENCATIDDAIELTRKTPKACSTAMLIASGKPANAVIVEFDSKNLLVRNAKDGFVGAANGFMTLYQVFPDKKYTGRTGTALEEIQAQKGKVDLQCNIAGADGVPIRSMNLHSAMIDASSGRFILAMGVIPACDLPYKEFRLTEKGIAGPEKE